MAIIDFLKKQFIDIIEWTDDSRDTLSWRFPDEDKEIKNGAQLIVRESQAAQFVYLGEFGAYEKADLASRVRWTKFVAEEATKRKMGWAYWGFCDGFGVYDLARRAWVQPLRDALLPPMP